MANVKVEINEAGIRELLKSTQVQSVVAEAAKQVLSRCPDIGYGMSTGFTSQRAKAHVGTRSVYSIRHNSKHNTLLKALGGGG